MKNLLFVFDRMPNPQGCNFIEVENESGESVCAGEWRYRHDGLVELVVPIYGTADLQSELSALREELANTKTSLEAVTLNLSRADDLLQTRTADLLACGTRRKAAEQRNAILPKAYALIDHISGDYTGETKRRIDEILAALKPTESGASE